MVLAYDLLEDRRTIDIIITKFFASVILKWRTVLRIEIIVYVTGQKIRYKKPCRGIEQVREAERRKIKQFLLEKDLGKKNTRAVSVSSRARLNQVQNWFW